MAEGAYTKGLSRRKKVRGKPGDAKRDINAGLTEAQSVTITRLENAIRDRKTEKAYCVDVDGKIVSESITNNRRSARLLTPRNSVLIHNHPDVSFEKKQYGRENRWRVKCYRRTDCHIQRPFGGKSSYQKLYLLYPQAKGRVAT